MKYQIKGDKQLQIIHYKGLGLIYNDFSGKTRSRKNDNVLHAASCNDVIRAKTNIRKFYFFTKEDALKSLKKERGEEDISWRRCGNCSALGRDDIEKINKDLFEISDEDFNKKNQEENYVKVDNVFRENEVQSILVNYLRSKKYNVKENHRVASGLIDIVADKDDDLILIEVKGEDRGGYGSAEMNFMIGIGQLISRMTSKNAKYALAFPLTSNFKKVLRKYKGTNGFIKLELSFYTVSEDKLVKIFCSEEFLTFIKEL